MSRLWKRGHGDRRVREASDAALHDYDVFVSYKSDDVMLVRPVVDGLIAAGARVWFAEYGILLSGRDDFARAIDSAIRRSASGLLFTGDRYFESKECQKELDKLLEFVGAKHLLAVPPLTEPYPHWRYPALAESLRIDFVDCDSVVREVCEWLELPFLERPEPRRRAYRDAAGRHAGWTGWPNVFVGTLLDRRWQISLQGWTVEKDPAGSLDETDVLPEFKFATRSPVLYANVSGGLDVAPETQRLAGIVDDGIDDDRRVYDYLLEYAPRHLGNVGFPPIGVHLLFSSSGDSQMGLTYLSESPDGTSFWTRKVSCVLANDAVSATGEFVFTFGLVGGREHWRDYCLMTPVMDRLVASLRWE